MSRAAARSISRLMDVLGVAARIEKTPGFSTYLGLTPDFYAKLPPDELSFEKNTFHVRLPVTSSLNCYGDRPRFGGDPASHGVSLATYLAIIDETTTWALVLGDEKRGRAGVSVSLAAEWGPAAAEAAAAIASVDIHSTVTKIGRNLGFVDARISDAKTGGLVCHGSHIKYLPMGPLMDFAQSSAGAGLAKWYAENVLAPPEPATPRPLAALFDSFRMLSDTRASFRVEPAHASLGGPIHGGCQAMLLERAAAEGLRRLHPEVPVALDSIRVEYLSSPGRDEVEIEVQLLPVVHHHPMVPVRAVLLGKGRTSSIGTLHFRKLNPSDNLHARL